VRVATAIGVAVCILATTGTASAATGFRYRPDADTLALWHMDEGKGEVIDESGNAVEALIEGVGAWDNNEDWDAGATGGSSFSFDGSTMIAIASDVEVVQPDIITVEAWVYPTALDGWKLICAHWGGAIVGSYHLGVEAGTPKFHINTGGGTFFAPALDQLELDAWTHVAGTYDGSDVRIYIDGEEAGSASANGDLESGSPDHDVIIGGKASREFPWNGLLDEVRISGIARDADELSPNLSGPQAVDPSADTLPTLWAALRSGD
jgi:hypothetical protein